MIVSSVPGNPGAGGGAVQLRLILLKESPVSACYEISWYCLFKMDLLTLLSKMAYVLAVSLTADLKAFYDDAEKMFNAQFIPMISHESISRFIIFYFFGFNFSDMLINWRVRGICTCCTPIRMFPPSVTLPAPPLGAGVMTKGRKILGSLSGLPLKQRGQGQILSLLFWTFLRTVKSLIETYFL